MTFEIEVAGRSRTVTVEGPGRGDRFRITIDGRRLDVVARRAGADGLLLTLPEAPPEVPGTFSGKVPGTLAEKWLEERGLARATVEKPTQKVPGTFSGKVPALSGGAGVWEVAVAPAGPAGQVFVTIRGRLAAVTVNGRRTGHAAETSRHAHGEQPVVAPMPGRVVRVLVAPGDEVAARQGVVVVEAMKMENELRAPKKGRVKDVSVSPGTSVEAGRVLVVIE